MIDFEKELESILEDDPLGLLAFKPKSSTAMKADERLVASFEEINAYIVEHGKEPEKSRNVQERKLYSRLKGIRENPEKAYTLREHDEHDLLADVKMPEVKEIESIDDILEDDILGLLDGPSESQEPDIFTLRHVTIKKDSPDMVARRRPCEEFELFEPLFKQVHADLATKKRVTRPFNSEKQIKPNTFFINKGMLVYVANKGDWEKRNFSNYDARLYVVFENGTESNLLLRSLASHLWRDDASREIIESDQLALFEEDQTFNSDDNVTGTIYVLKSLSSDPEIRAMKNLHKIGFSVQPVEERIKNAANEPTYLMADVMIVTEFLTANVNPQKVESLLHRFFAHACLEVDVFDHEGKRHMPREWFDVPLHIIETAVNLLVNGEIVNYRYYAEKEEIVARA